MMAPPDSAFHAHTFQNFCAERAAIGFLMLPSMALDHHLVAMPA
jgi:hypothetical protein